MNISRTESIYGIAALSVGFAIFILFLVLGPNQLLQKHSQAAAAVTSANHILPPDVFKDITIEGRAAVVYDAVEGTFLYQKNAAAQLPLASIAKVFLALIAAEQLPTNDIIIISESALATEGDWGFKIGEKWDVEELLNLTLMASANDGATAIAERIEEKNYGTSIEKIMNERARALGLTETYFLNETGLDVHEELLSGSYGSATDVAHAFAYITRTYPELLLATTYPSGDFVSRDGYEYHLANTDLITAHIPNFIGGKTGYTDLAGGNLAVAFETEPGHPIVVIVLGSSKEGRFTDVMQLIQAVLRRNHLGYGSN